MMFNKINKKGDLSINMVIVAAIAILVLIVVVMIFSGKMRTFGKATESCDSAGGVCSNDAATDACMTTNIGCKAACGGDLDKVVVLRGTDCESDQSHKRVCCKTIY